MSFRAEINEMEATASSGGGAVTVTVTGKKEIKDIVIKAGSRRLLKI